MSEHDLGTRITRLEEGQRHIAGAVSDLTDRLFGENGEIRQLRDSAEKLMKFQYLMLGIGTAVAFALKLIR